MNKSHYLIDLKDLGDERGSLVVIEGEKEIPFPIRRMFYDFNTDPTISRGNHANKESRFGFISLQGSCVVEVDDGFTKTEYTLNSPRKCLVINKMVWKVMKFFSIDNILLVISDNHYDANEYIKDYSEFIKLVTENQL